MAELRRIRTYFTLVAATLVMVGLSASQASAQGPFLDLLQDIKAKTDALPSDPASQSAVEAEMFTNVAMYRILSVGSSEDRITCSSDRDMIVHASLHVAGDGGGLSVTTLFQDGGSRQNNMTIDETVGLTFGAEAGDELQLRTTSLGQPDFVFATVTVQTAAGANVSCVVD